MKFLVDAQLPFKVAVFLRQQGFDVTHTDDLPQKDRTSDNQIRDIARIENRIIISKDADFLDSHIVKKQPEKLLLISTGNIKNRELIGLLERNWQTIVQMFDYYSLIELTNTEVIAHE